MEHSIKVQVGKGINMREGAILGCRKRSLRNRALSAVLTRVYGNPIPTLLLIPADSVESISICENAESKATG